MKNNKDIVVIPLYNEESTIVKTIENVTLNTDANILVIDDGSTDNSFSLLKSNTRIAIIRNPVNKGYGSTLIQGFNYAIENNYKSLVTIDCDEQHEPRMIPLFFQELNGYDILSGSRYLMSFPEDNEPPPERLEVNRSITKIINKITGFNLTDSFCGFKAYQVDSIKRFSLTELGYGMPLQLWIQAWAKRMSVKEKGVVRIYKDLTRSFGKVLDNSSNRVEYYKHIIKAELQRTGNEYSMYRRSS